MSDTIFQKKITEDLDFLKKEISNIKEHMIDSDALLSKNEELIIKKSRDEYHKGKSIRLEDLEKQLK